MHMPPVLEQWLSLRNALYELAMNDRHNKSGWAWPNLYRADRGHPNDLGTHRQEALIL